MRKKFNSIVEDELALFNAVLIVLAIILGTVVRFHFISGTDFPVNDGGLFYQMVDDLIENDLRLPQFTLYNQDEIPFAYPPLAFYFIAILKNLTGISLFSLLRYVPLSISVGTIVAFYFLAKEIIRDQILPGIATLLFALVPRAFEWYVMGGGITRALGFLFSVLAIHSIWQLFEGKKGTGVIIRVAVFSGFTVLSHPETALFVVFSAIVLILYHGITRENILKSLLVAGGVLVIISPWIVSVIFNHGLAPFTSAGGTGHSLWFEIKNFITLKFGFENGEFLSVYSGLAIIAIFTRKDKLTWTLFGMLFFGYLFFPRSGPNFLTIWVSILAALGLSELLWLTSIKTSRDEDFYKVLADDWKAKIVLVLVIIYLFLGAYTYKFIFGKDQLRITDEIHETFVWLGENTKQDEVFLIYPSIEGNHFWWNDYLSEWFPVISKRQSVTTVQGYEWVSKVFDQKIYSYIQLRSCEQAGPACVNTWERENNRKIDYIIIDTNEKRPDFLNSFNMEQDYDLFYDGGRIVVYKRY